MSLVEVVSGNPDRIKVTSELSGACTPYASGAPAYRRCDTQRFSSLTLPFIANDHCHEGNLNARTCPWGMLKWQPAQGNRLPVQVVNGQSEWFERHHSGLFTSTSTDGELQLGSVKLRLDLLGSGGGVDLPVDTAGIGSYVTTIDRVLWSFEEDGSPGTACTTSCTIVRKQCWGDLDNPSSATTPSFAGTTFTSSSSVKNCDGLDGTGWEVMATGVKSASLSYYTGGAWTSTVNVNTDAEAIRAVRLELTMEKIFPGKPYPLTQTYRRDYFLDNRDQP